MEKFSKSSSAQITAAAVFAISIALVVGLVVQRPEIARDAEVTSASDQDLASPAVPAGPVSGALPTEPDPAIADVEPAPETPKFANAILNKKAPPPRKESQAGLTKPAPAEKPVSAAKSGEQTVLHVRQLQTQLMVGALSCGRPHMQSNYNSFVTKFDHALKANGQALKSYFTRTFGARGVNEMDAFLTKLSNELSLVSMRHNDFCERTDGLFETVLALAPAQIETFADRYLSQALVAREGF